MTIRIPAPRGLSLRAIALSLAVVCSAMIGIAGEARADDTYPYWVKTMRETQLFAAADASASTKGTVTAYSYFAVTGPPKKGRVPAVELGSPRTGFLSEQDVERGTPPPDPAAVSTVPAPAVSPSVPGSTPPQTRTTPGVFAPFWVSNFAPASLWNGAEEKAMPLGVAEPGHWFQVLEQQNGPRLHVRDRIADKDLWIEAASMGPVDAPTEQEHLGKWWGTVGADGINVRSGPDTNSSVIGQLPTGSPVVVDDWVEGADVFGDQPGWAQIGSGAYIYGPLLRRVDLGAPPLPVAAPTAGKWIDVNLTLQVMTAYEGQSSMYSAPVSSGRPGWETTMGTHRIMWRKEVETMESNHLLSVDAARANYRVENVKYTQYFTNDGQAIHENYWRDPALFGIPSSHGCLGLLPADARWFWDWGQTGTPVVVHG
jgi:hypothetical protein